jgi:outer membrane receptor for ferric coprogen and ferric-rhodotorulic acid
MIQTGYTEIFSFGPGLFNLDDVGNPRLKPTVVQDYSADYSREIKDIYSTIKTSVYYEESHDITAPFQFYGPVATFNGQPYIVASAQNIGDSKGWGAEIQIKGSHPQGLRWDASYSYSRVVDSNSAVTSSVNYAGSAPTTQLRLLLGYSSGPWEFDTNTQYVTGTTMLRSFNGGGSSAPVATGGFASLGGRMGYKLSPHFTLALSGTNLTRKSTMVSPYPAIQRQVFLTLTGKL